MGVPRPTAIMVRTNGEKESTGGEPEPSRTVLEQENILYLIRTTGNHQNHQSYPPAEELGAVVERFSRQAEAHVQSQCLRFCVEPSDQSGRRRGLRPRVGVPARRGELQRRVGLPVRHRLPLEEPQNLGAAVPRGHPLRHLRGQRSRGYRRSAPPLPVGELSITLKIDGVNSSSMDRRTSTRLRGLAPPTACSSSMNRERVARGNTPSSHTFNWEESAVWRRRGQD